MNESKQPPRDGEPDFEELARRLFGVQHYAEASVVDLGRFGK